MMIAAIRCQDLKLAGNKQHVYEILRFFKRFTLKINKRKFHFFFFCLPLPGLRSPPTDNCIYQVMTFVCHSADVSVSSSACHENKKIKNCYYYYYYYLLLKIVNRTTRGLNVILLLRTILFSAVGTRYAIYI